MLKQQQCSKAAHGKREAIASLPLGIINLKKSGSYSTYSVQRPIQPSCSLSCSAPIYQGLQNVPALTTPPTPTPSGAFTHADSGVSLSSKCLPLQSFGVLHFSSSPPPLPFQVSPSSSSFSSSNNLFQEGLSTPHS